jgi:hypothetical protein
MWQEPMKDAPYTPWVRAAWRPGRNAAWQAAQDVISEGYPGDVGIDRSGNVIAVIQPTPLAAPHVVRRDVSTGSWTATSLGHVSGKEPPRAAVADNGRAAVIWRNPSGGASVARADSSGRWSAPEVVSPAGAATGSHRIGIASDGSVIAGFTIGRRGTAPVPTAAVFAQGRWNVTELDGARSGTRSMVGVGIADANRAVALWRWRPLPQRFGRTMIADLRERP